MNDDDYELLQSEAKKVFRRNKLQPLSVEDFQQDCCLYALERENVYGSDKQKILTIPHFLAKSLYRRKKITKDILSSSEVRRDSEMLLSEREDEHQASRIRQVEDQIHGEKVLDLLVEMNDLSSSDKRLLRELTFSDDVRLSPADQKRLERLRIKLKNQRDMI